MDIALIETGRGGVYIVDYDKQVKQLAYMWYFRTKDNRLNYGSWREFQIHADGSIQYAVESPTKYFGHRQRGAYYDVQAYEFPTSDSNYKMF